MTFPVFSSFSGIFEISSIFVTLLMFVTFWNSFHALEVLFMVMRFCAGSRLFQVNRTVQKDRKAGGVESRIE